jgi:hypothetical protein
MTYSDKELINIAKEKQKETVKDWKMEQVLDFIVSCEIESGDAEIENALIYEMYRKWNGKKDLLTRDMFFRRFAKFFQRKIHSGFRTYQLNPAPFDLSIENKTLIGTKNRREYHLKQRMQDRHDQKEIDKKKGQS